MPPPSSTTRASLLDRLRRGGDDQAWRDFSDRYRDLLLRFALRRGLQIHDAEDVVQATLARLPRAMASFEYRPEVGSFRGYLRKIAENEIRRAASRRSAAACTPLGDDDVDVPATSAGHDEVWEEEWMQHHYRLALATARDAVAPKTFETFMLLVEGLSAAETAQRQGITLDAVYKVKQRMRERLQEALDAQFEDEEHRERSE